jgi:DNA-binding FrmR family transcriptional regulator
MPVLPLPGFGSNHAGRDKTEVIKRLNFIEGISRHPRMVEADKCCVDVPKTYAVRRAIEKMEAIMLAGHLHTCVVEGIRDGREDAVLAELSELYEMAGK